MKNNSHEGIAINYFSDTHNPFSLNSSVSNKSCSLTSQWHMRLGHVPRKYLSKIASLHNMHLKDHSCTVCPIAKRQD